MGRQRSQTEGMSVDSQPARLRSCLICGGILVVLGGVVGSGDQVRSLMWSVCTRASMWCLIDCE